MANMERHLGIDIGGTNIACGIVNENGEIVARSKVKTNSTLRGDTRGHNPRRGACLR